MCCKASRECRSRSLGRQLIVEAGKSAFRVKGTGDGSGEGSRLHLGAVDGMSRGTQLEVPDQVLEESHLSVEVGVDLLELGLKLSGSHSTAKTLQEEVGQIGGD